MWKGPGPIHGAAEATPQTGRAWVPTSSWDNSAPCIFPAPLTPQGIYGTQQGWVMSFCSTSFWGILPWPLLLVLLCFFFIVVCFECLLKNSINQTQDQTWVPVHWEHGVSATETSRRPQYPCFEQTLTEFCDLCRWPRRVLEELMCRHRGRASHLVWSVSWSSEHHSSQSEPFGEHISSSLGSNP